jgi:hypothetical protein
MGDKKNTTMVLMEKPEKKTLEKPSSIWQDNIKTVLKETG